MDMLWQSAKAFEKLLDIQYNIVIGRKSKSFELCIGFSKIDFHHLMGLSKLKDLRIARKNREDVFDDILSGKTTYISIHKSNYFMQIQNRFEPFINIESLFDNNRLIFRYNEKINQFSLIQADYLLSTPYLDNDIYIFISKNNKIDKYYCRSFFPKEFKDYTIGQPVYTMLYKEKINLVTGKKQIQFDKLNSNLISKDKHLNKISNIENQEYDEENQQSLIEMIKINQKKIKEENSKKLHETIIKNDKFNEI